ncbi:Nn.00g041210.m01.CDS01 [Neocucurbitaria sp. VM-36]
MSLAGPTFANKEHNPLYIQVFAGPQEFYTSGDPIEGIVRVEPSTRPVHISIRFKGLSIIYDTNASGIKPEFFEYSRDLFVSTGAGENFDILRRGTADDGRVELPFSFMFPHTVRLAPPSDRTWWYSKDPYNHPRFQHSPGFPLPPSCAQLTSGSGPLAPKIMYYLEARMESPESANTTVRQGLKYIPPDPDYQPTLLQPDLNFGLKLPKHCCRYKFIRTRKLLPGYRESSKLGKVRDLLVEKELFFGLVSYSEIPFARFNLFATPARVLVIGASVPIIVTIQHLDRSKSLPSPPDLFLRRLRVQLISSFNTFVPDSGTGRRGSKEVVDKARETFTLFDRKFDAGDGEPLYNGLKIQELGNVTMTHERLLPSFTSYGISLEYELQVEIWGECAKHEFLGTACKEPVQIVSGLVTSAQHEVDGILEAGSRPVYQELDPMLSIHEIGTSARPHELYAGETVQELDAQFDSRPIALQSNSRAIPPPPYVG